MASKKFEFYIVLNWKTGTVNAKKRKPKEGLSDIVVKMRIDVKIPENKMHIWKGEIEVPETKVGDIFMDMV